MEYFASLRVFSPIFLVNINILSPCLTESVWAYDIIVLLPLYVYRIIREIMDWMLWILNEKAFP